MYLQAEDKVQREEGCGVLERTNEFRGVYKRTRAMTTFTRQTTRKQSARVLEDDKNI